TEPAAAGRERRAKGTVAVRATGSAVRGLISANRATAARVRARIPDAPAYLARAARAATLRSRIRRRRQRQAQSERHHDQRLHLNVLLLPSGIMGLCTLA